MKMKAFLMSACALGAVALSAGTACAQDVVAPTPTPVEDAAAPAQGDIVVTAQRREQTLQDTPIAITAFNNAMIEQRAIVKVQDIAASTPGLLIMPVTASPNAIAISMRGALEVNGGSITSESPVALYIDDVYQSRLSAANYDTADIVRIEVLRGPQGTLYGRNSMTGAVKLITRQPNGETWMNTDVSYSSFQESKVKASIGAPITEHLAIAASGFYDDRDKGWQYDRALGRDVGKFRKYGAQVALGVTNVTGLEAVLTARYGASLTDGQYYVPLNLATNTAIYGFYDTNTPREQYGNTRQWTTSGRLGYDFGAFTVRSITAYSHLTDNLSLDFSGGYTLPGTNTVVTGFNRQSTASQHQFTEELQVLGKAFDDKFNWIVGGFYYDEAAQQTFTNDNFAAFGLQYRPTHYETQSHSLAFYAQGDYALTDKLKVSAGIRYSDDRKEIDALTPAFPGLDATLVPGHNRTTAKVWTPRFNVQYDLTRNAMIYATVSKGYRAGGFNSLIIANPAVFGTAYKPETAWSYEGGVKFQTADRVASLNIAAYYETLSDLQTLADDGKANFIFQNAASAKVWGVESEATLKPFTHFSLYGNLTYTGDKYGKLDPSTQAAQAGADRLPLLSRWQGQVGGSYDLPLGNDNTLVFAGNWHYRSPYYFSVSLSPYGRMDAQSRADVSITYKLPQDRLEFYFQAKNVSNSKDYYGGIDFIPGVFGFKLPLEPRVLTGGFRFKI
jgi:iron complex outermembrane receptor protein